MARLEQRRPLLRAAGALARGGDGACEFDADSAGGLYAVRAVRGG